MIIKAVINKITGEKHIYRNIQPEQDMTGQFGNGWKGVYRWCETNVELIPALFSAISPALDLLSPKMYCGLELFSDSWIIFLIPGM